MLLLGLILGIILSGLAFVYILKKYMMVSVKIEGSFDEVEQAVKSVVPQFKGWGFPIPDWQFYKSQLSKGLSYDNIKSMVMHFVCNPMHANKVLKVDPKLAGIMPCTWAVYEDKNGGVFIAKMNIALMSRMYFGVIGKVMKDVADIEKKMLAEVKKKIAENKLGK